MDGRYEVIKVAYDLQVVGPVGSNRDRSHEHYLDFRFPACLHLCTMKRNHEGLVTKAIPSFSLRTRSNQDFKVASRPIPRHANVLEEKIEENLGDEETAVKLGVGPIPRSFR